MGVNIFSMYEADLLNIPRVSRVNVAECKDSQHTWIEFNALVGDVVLSLRRFRQYGSLWALGIERAFQEFKRSVIEHVAGCTPKEETQNT